MDESKHIEPFVFIEKQKRLQQRMLNRPQRHLSQEITLPYSQTL